jgi:tyrosine-protein kinase Etk/Wzc
LTQPHHSHADTPEIDLPTLGRALWRTKGTIIALSIGAAVLTFVVLSMMRPLYTSEARILIQNDESAFTQPADTQARDMQQRTLDEQAVQSQVQVLTSRDLADQVINDLDLINNPDFAKDTGTNPAIRFLNSMGLAKPSAESQNQQAANTFADYLSVFPLSKSSVIAVNYTSGDASLAAKVANKLADVYINWQREAKLEQTKDATAWLSAQIDVLRNRVAEAEEAAERFRSSQGLFSGTNNTTLNAQQLSELNSQVILARAQKSETEARARLIKKMIADKGDIDATPEVLKSELITRLIDQRVQVQRQLAELSATLLPSHPRIKQLTSELADVRRQIRDEALKIANSLENEAQVASARETSLRNSLNEVKTQASGQTDAEVKLRALEREAKAQRDLLESYLGRYRDASARHDMGSVPAQATIVSRAHASIQPSFPKRSALSLLVAVATALLGLSYVVARELIGAPAQMPAPAHAAEPRARERRRALPAEPAAVPAVASAAPQRATEPTAAVSPAQAESRLPSATVAASPAAPAASAQPSLPPVAASPRAEADDLPSQAKPKPAPVVPQPAETKPAAATQSAAGFLERLRRGVAPGATPTAAPQPSGGWLGRIRPARRAEEGTSDAVSPTAGNMPVLRTNDLRHYLNQRLAASAAEAANDSPRKANAAASKPDSDKVGPVLKSLDAVLNHILAAGKGGAPRALLVAGATAKLDATAEAIAIARALARREQVVLVDLTRGPASISGALGLPRMPGLTDLVAGRAGFEDVVRIDEDSALQVISAGNPKLSKDDENERFGRLFEALTHTYDSVVLHADDEAVRQLTPALKFELPIVVAVLPAGAGDSGSKTDLAEFQALGCPVLVYEQAGKKRSRFFERVAAV